MTTIDYIEVLGYLIYNIVMNRKEELTNIVFVFTSIILMCLVIFFNYKMDPFDIFNSKNSEYKPYKYGFEREFLNIKLKAEKNKKYETLVIGGSVAKQCFKPHLLIKSLPLDKTCVLSLENATTSDLVYITNLFAQLHPELKKVYYCVEIGIMIDSPGDMTIKKYNGNNFTKDDFLTTLFSLKTTELSLKQLALKVSGEENSDGSQDVSGVQACQVFPYVRLNYVGCKAKESDIEKIIRLSKDLKAKNIEAVFFIPSYHSLHLANLYYDSLFPEVERVKKELAEGIGIYDFSYANKYSNMRLPDKKDEYITFYAFIDPVHAANDMGVLMLQKLFSKKGDVGIFIDKSNIDASLEYQKAELKKYIENNKDAVSIYRTRTTRPSSPDWQYNVYSYKVVKRS